MNNQTSNEIQHLRNMLSLLNSEIYNLKQWLY